MLKKRITNSLYKLARKIVRRFYFAGVFEILNQPKSNLKNINIIKGEKSDVDLSAILITKGTGRIILKPYTRIGRSTELQPSSDGYIKIGRGTSIQDRNIILGDVEIGQYCLTAPNVYMSSGRHYFDLNANYYIKDQDAMVLSSPDLLKSHSKKITVEDDVWIGINSVIMSGVTIGRGSIIGANSVVTKDVLPFSIMVGSPAKLIKKRLEFVPKPHIFFDNDNDLPNFYKGFFVDLKNLADDRNAGGVAATGSFIAYLDSASKMKLIIKNITNSPLTLNYNEQEVMISSHDFEEIYFNMEKGNYHKFSIKSKESDDDTKFVLVKDIKTLN